MSAVDVNDLIGKPWRLGARGPEAFDCWGLVREVMQRMHPDKALPEWTSDGMTRERQRALLADEVPTRCDLAPALNHHGALLYSERAAHIAIVVDGWALTAVRRGGVVAMRTSNFAAMLPDLRAYTWRG